MTTLKRNKIYFHYGPDAPGSNLNGIGTSMRQLNSAGIRFFLKGVDHYGVISEVINEVDPADENNHTLVFRLSDRDNVYTFDTPLYHHPDYIDDPEGAADIHVDMTLLYLPPEFNKERVWLELTNEVDRNKCEWLGRFALHAARKLNGLGYKVALFGWASGEPEPIGWEEPSMLNFLRYCADNKGRCAVSIHEYSYIVTEILHEYPFKIGRFQYLFATCDKHSIGRPTTLITEWGWTLNDVPEPTKAMQDIDVVAKLYAQYDDILGAAIWYLGPGFGIADKTQKLIQPVTDYTLNTALEQSQTEIPVLPEVGEWKQYGEKVTINYSLNGTIGKITAQNGGVAESKLLKIRQRKWDSRGWFVDVDVVEIELNPECTNINWDVTFTEQTNPNPLPVIENPLVVDYSHWQGATNHVVLKSAGVQKFMSKITEHTTYVDNGFLTRYQNALASGYKKEDIAPYHFYRFNKSPIDQANHFVNTYKLLAGTPVCAFVADVEDVDNSAVGKQNELKLFLDVVEYLTGFKPIIYTGSWWWTTARWGGAVPWAKEYALVEAEYPLDPPAPDYVDFDAAYNWTKTHKPTIHPDFTAHSSWQFTSKANGTAFGVSSKYLDVQAFNGNLEQLNALYAKKGNVLIDPRPGNKIDMLQYIRGPHGMQYEMRRPDGAQERYQIQWDVANPQVWYIVKGENQGHYEKWSFDNDFIYLEMDTSPSPASDGTQRYYTIKKNGVRSAKYRRWMGVGEVYDDGGHFVQFNNKTNCQPHAENSGEAANNTVFTQGPYTDVFYNNITLPDVIKCQENSEMQYWAKNHGRVRWESTWGSSQLSEIHGIGSRPDIQREFIPCVS